MACQSSITIPNPAGKKQMMTVPCGKCIECLRDKQRQWQTRLKVELMHSTNSYFITLTYDDEHLPINEGLQTLRLTDLQNFIKRLRRYTGNKSIRYFAVGEYGERMKRPHYHLLLFNLVKDQDKAYKQIVKAWTLKKMPIGRVHIGKVEGASINYCTKYILWKAAAHWWTKTEKPFSIMSKRPPIGHQYITKKKVKYHQRDTDNTLIRLQGESLVMPRYYKEKLYSKLQRDKRAEKFKREMSNDEVEAWQKKNNVKSYFEYQHDQFANQIRKAKKTLK